MEFSATLPSPVVKNPFPDLPDTARTILAAARRVLLKSGFQALTLSAIGEEAGQNGALVSYYFGNKDGLIAALVDSIVYDECVSTSSRMHDVPLKELERENAHLRRAVSDLTLDKLILQEAARGNF
jgi:AcrR family transcriptional regulator